jgi:glycosyltransferase involved in cell wall biosynthesis
VLDQTVTETGTRVTVAVAVFNQAHFLADALTSIARQTRPADEVIVVDDGSHDAPDRVVAPFQNVRLIRRQNGGLSAARNTALEATNCGRIVFLDADDVLEPRAIASGLGCFERVPDAAFVYGAHRRLGPKLETLTPYCLEPLRHPPQHAFLLGNAVGMHATAMFDVAILKAAGGFDRNLPRCEDYDAYCRLSRSHPIAFHNELVAGYRQHGSNMSVDHRTMLHWALTVLDRYRPAEHDRAGLRAWREGRARWRAHYAVEASKSALHGCRARDMIAAAADLVNVPPAALAKDLARRAGRLAGARP